MCAERVIELIPKVIKIVAEETTVAVDNTGLALWVVVGEALLTSDVLALGNSLFNEAVAIVLAFQVAQLGQDGSIALKMLK